MFRRLVAIAALTALAAGAQQISFEALEKRLAGKGSQTTEVNLDGALLGLASKFLNSGNPDEAKAKQLLQDIKAIYVRVWEFDKEGEFTTADLDGIRASLKGWTKVVDVRSTKASGDNAGVYMQLVGDKIQGLVVLAAERRELTVVNIVGSIDPERLRDLGGQFGIPRLGFDSKKKGNKE